MNFQLKKFPEDFYVVESLVLPITNCKDDDYHYYSLTKKNVSTFDGIRILSDRLGCEAKKIGYAGLKDEDGVTTQTVSSPSKLFFESEINFTSTDLNVPNSFMKLHYIGSGNIDIKIGVLTGNSFRIIIRGITNDLEQCLNSKQKFTEYFLNYYGPQRFGLPNQEKNTHIIGELLHRQRFTEALALLSKQNSFIGDKAKNFKASAKDFFCEIDERQHAFFLNSYESYEWNQELTKLILSLYKKGHSITNSMGLDYLYLNDRLSLINLLSFHSVLPYKKTFYYNNVKQEVNNDRNTVIQVDMFCHKVFIDSADNKCCELSFFLPSGSYATMAIDQILMNMASKAQLLRAKGVYETASD